MRAHVCLYADEQTRHKPRATLDRETSSKRHFDVTTSVPNLISTTLQRHARRRVSTVIMCFSNHVVVLNTISLRNCLCWRGTLIKGAASAVISSASDAISHLEVLVMLGTARTPIPTSLNLEPTPKLCHFRAVHRRVVFPTNGINLQIDTKEK